MVKNPPTMQEMQVQSLGREDPLEKGTANHSSIHAWEISWTEEPGGLQSTGSQRVRHDLVTKQQPGRPELGKWLQPEGRLGHSRLKRMPRPGSVLGLTGRDARYEEGWGSVQHTAASVPLLGRDPEAAETIILCDAAQVCEYLTCPSVMRGSPAPNVEISPQNLTT